ncbi:MAG: hypothetical protein LLF94_11970 [Chlamydiales bacterium]|nr:hypothetical protein [Chlamydiales bacterium]
MTSLLKKIIMPELIVDYDEEARIHALTNEFAKTTLDQTPQEKYHLCSYTEIQAIVWAHFKNFSESKDPTLIPGMVMALVAYNQSMAHVPEIICSVATDEFLDLADRPTTNLPILLYSKIKSHFIKKSVYKKNKFREWSDTLTVFSRLAREVCGKSVGAMLVDCYKLCKEQQKLSGSSLVAILFVLSEISCILTEDHPEFSFEQKSISHMVRLAQLPGFPEGDAATMLSLCFHSNLRRGALFIEEMFFKGPINHFLGCVEDDVYIEHLERLLLGNNQYTFTEYNAEKTQKIFVTLLVASFAKDNQKAFNLLLLVLPQCAPYITGVYVEALKAALMSSQADVCKKVSQVMSSFTGKTEVAWDMVSHVLKQLEALSIDRPIVMLNKAIEQWNVVMPRASVLARVVRLFARHSTETNVHQLFAKLVKDDEDQCRKDMTRVVFVKPKFMMGAFLAFLQIAHPELNGKEPSWIETLEGKEVEAFIEIAKSIRLRKEVRESLYCYLARDNASEKSLYIATRIAHCFGARQVVKLATKLSNAMLDVLVTHDFSEDVRNALFLYFSDHQDSSQLVYASRLYKEIDFTKVEQLISRLDASTPTEFVVTDMHKSVLKSVIGSPWIKESDSTLQSTDDVRIKEFVSKLTSLLKKFWLEDDIPQQNIDTRLNQMITGVH